MSRKRASGAGQANEDEPSQGASGPGSTGPGQEPPPDQKADDLIPAAQQKDLKPTSRSLSDQVKIHEFEIAFRKQLLGFDVEEEHALARVQKVVLDGLDGIVDKFYERLTSVDEIGVIIGDRGTFERLLTAQRTYIQDVFSGSYGEDYVDSRLRIGLVHKRMGVEPKFYLAAVSSLLVILRSTLESEVSDPKDRAAAMRALEKLIFFDTTLVFDTYIHSMLTEIEVARDKAARYAVMLEKEVEDRTRELVRISRIDSLTGLLEKRAFLEEFRRELARSRRLDHPLVLVYFDVDRFKDVNDSRGHGHGDKVLTRIGLEIKRCRRELDLAGRFGGDEFFLALPGTTEDGAVAFMDRLETRINAATGVSISFGVVVTDREQPRSVEDLLMIADQRMYQMKAERRRSLSDRKGTGQRPRTKRPGSDSMDQDA